MHFKLILTLSFFVLNCASSPSQRELIVQFKKDWEKAETKQKIKMYPHPVKVLSLDVAEILHEQEIMLWCWDNPEEMFDAKQFELIGTYQGFEVKNKDFPNGTIMKYCSGKRPLDYINLNWKRTILIETIFNDGCGDK